MKLIAVYDIGEPLHAMEVLNELAKRNNPPTFTFEGEKITLTPESIKLRRGHTIVAEKRFKKQ